MDTNSNNSNKNETGYDKSYTAGLAMILMNLNCLQKKVDKLEELVKANSADLDILDTKCTEILEDLGDEDYLDEIDGSEELIFTADDDIFGDDNEAFCDGCYYGTKCTLADVDCDLTYCCKIEAEDEEDEDD